MRFRQQHCPRSWRSDFLSKRDERCDRRIEFHSRFNLHRRKFIESSCCWFEIRSKSCLCQSFSIELGKFHCKHIFEFERCKRRLFAEQHECRIPILLVSSQFLQRLQWRCSVRGFECSSNQILFHRIRIQRGARRLEWKRRCDLLRECDASKLLDLQQHCTVRWRSDSRANCRCYKLQYRWQHCSEWRSDIC